MRPSILTAINTFNKLIEKMQVLFDHHVFSWQKFGGVSKYFVELIQYLRKENVKCSLPFLFTKNYYIQSLTNNYLKVKDVKGTYHIIELINKFNSIRILKGNHYDLFHPTSTSNYFYSHLNNKPFVVTAHDLTIELFPSYFKSNEFVSKTIEERKLNYNRANRIIAISENTKKDLIHFYNINPGKIDVIYHGYSKPGHIQEPIRNFRLDKNRYILYVGSRKEYKNFNNFIEACAPVVKGDSYIICAGGGGFSAIEKEKLSKLKIENKVFQYDVNSSELNFLYKNAIVFVYPSLYEGFGMPILEAFANGCRVAISNILVFTEIAGNAATYFDPNSVESIREAILKIINSPEKGDAIKEQSTQRLSNFSWETTASKTIETYKKVINKP